MKKRIPFKRTYPLAGILLFLVIALTPVLLASAYGISSVTDLFSDSEAIKALGCAVAFPIAPALASVVMGIPLAYVMARLKTPLKGLLRFLCCLYLVLPPILVALGLLQTGALLPNNYVKVFLAMMVLNVPAVAYIVSEHWVRIDHRIEQSAASLGTKPRRIFRTITLPRLRPAILLSCSFSFIRCLSCVAVGLPLGDGSAPDAGSLVAITEASNHGVADAMSMVCTVLSIVVLVIFLSSLKKTIGCQGSGDADTSCEKKPRIFIGKALAIVSTVLFILILLAPLCLTLFGSLKGQDGLTFSSYAALAHKPFLCSLIIACSSALLASIIATRLSYAAMESGFSAIMALLPLAAGSCIVGLGYKDMVLLIPSIPAMVTAILANTAVVVPPMVLLITAMIRRIPEDLGDVSMSLGVSESTSFRRIDRRILRPASLAAAVLALIVSFGDLGATMMLNVNNIPMQIYSLITSGDVQMACTYGSILLVVVVALFSIFTAIKRKCHA